jgi:hypothetical protein
MASRRGEGNAEQQLKIAAAIVSQYRSSLHAD